MSHQPNRRSPPVDGGSSMVTFAACPIIQRRTPSMSPYAPGMSGIVSRWPVLQRHAVDSTDLDANGAVRTEVALGWIAAACDAYLERCTVLRAQAAPDGLAIQQAAITLRSGALAGKPSEIAIS